MIVITEHELIALLQLQPTAVASNLCDISVFARELIHMPANIVVFLTLRMMNFYWIDDLPKVTVKQKRIEKD